MEKSSCLEFDSSTINSTPSPSMQIEPNTTEFSVFIEKLSPILHEIKNSIEITELRAVQKAVESLENDYTRVKTALGSQDLQSSSPTKQIEYLIQNLGRSLGLVLFASHDVPMSNKEKIEALCKEMMNVKFDQSSENESEFVNEETEEEEEEEEEIEEVEDKGIVVSTIDDVIMNIRYGDEEKLKNAVLELNVLIMNGAITDDAIVDEHIIKILFDRLVSSEGNERATIIPVLRQLNMMNHQHKEVMKYSQYLSVLVTSLTRDVEERKEAVALLLSLSDDPAFRKKIGRIQGCIMSLVAISNGDDQEASAHAKELLNSMSTNTQLALNMTEAGYFKPLINYLKEGSDMSKVLMATTLSRMDLTDQNKDTLGEEGSIEPLVKMFKTGNLEAKLSAINALQNLSNSKQNIQRLICSGIVVQLLQLLFSVTSVLMTLREPASAILAKVAQSETILVKRDIAHQMLSLLNLSSPIIQNHLFDALNNITSHSGASRVRKKMMENGAIQLLLPFFKETDTKIRTGALKLVYTLSNDIKGEILLVEQMGYTHLNDMVDIVLLSKSECEKVAALGIISNFPLSDKKITDLLKNANLFRALVSIMSSSIPENSTCLSECVAGILIRFTVPSDKRLQYYSVENGIIPVLLKLLSSSSEIAKSRAAICFAQLSQNSLQLSKSRKLKWFCMNPSVDDLCEVHDGHCSVKSTFCLVKTGAVTPLIQVLEGENRGVDEAILGCLSTLLQDEIWESGCNYLVKSSGVGAVIKVLELGNLKSQEKALWILERVFRVESYRAQYCESAKVVLIDLTQNGDPLLKPLILKLLEQLGHLQVQSI